MHALQPRDDRGRGRHGALNRQIAELATEVASKADLPADVKASFDALKKEVAALAPKLTAGGGGPGLAVAAAAAAAGTSVVAQVGQAKNGLTGGHVAELDDAARLRRGEGAAAQGDRGRELAVRARGLGLHLTREAQPQAGRAKAGGSSACGKKEGGVAVKNALGFWY